MNLTGEILKVQQTKKGGFIVRVLDGDEIVQIYSATYDKRFVVGESIAVDVRPMTGEGRPPLFRVSEG